MPTLLRDAPFSALYWPGYEFIRHLSAWELVLSRRSDMSSFVGDFVAGAVSGGCAAFITTPIDVVKTRRQMNAHQNTNVKKLKFFKKKENKKKEKEQT